MRRTNNSYSKTYYLEHKKEIYRRTKKWRKRNIERWNQICRNWARNNPEKVKRIRAEWWLKRYGLSLSKKKEMFLLQNGCCAICQKKLKLSEAKVDHKHGTKKARGILCNYCNLMLGFAKDSIKVLKQGIKYLKEAS